VQSKESKVGRAERLNHLHKKKKKTVHKSGRLWIKM